MPAPTSNDEFLDLVRKSGVIDASRLQTHIDRLRDSGQLPDRPDELARQLIRDGVITHFQAEQFMQGKWRRFTIGKYKVLERLGAGGMGSVYLCEHMLMRRRVAVKVLPASKANDSSSLDRFYREARAVAALDHPNIVRAYDIDKDDNLHFLVMEHVDGSSLQEIIKKTGPMDVTRATHYMRQAALGLQHAHETAALVHRDIKPGNVLVDRNGIVKVLDMGLARFFHDDTDDLTKKYDENVLGTADYLAPEQALDSHGADIRADIYSLGGTFYFCLTGLTPFSSGTVAQKLIWHQTRQPKPIRSLRPEVPEELVAIIDRMMMKDRNERYQSPADVADALAPWTQTPILPPPEAEMPQFSLAARAGTQTSEVGMGSSSRSQGETLPMPPRKPWQAAGAQAATATPRPAPQAPAVVAPPPRPQAPPPTPLPRPEPRSTPALEGNGVPAAVAAPPAIEPDLTEQESPEELELPTRTVPDIRRRGADRRRSPLVMGLVIAAVVLVPLTGFLLWLFLGTPEKKGGPPEKRAKEPIRVGEPNSPRLSSVLMKAKDGDRILVCGDVVESSVFVSGKKDVVIEAEPGKKVTWKCPSQVPAGTKLLQIQNAPGFQLRGITFDGGGEAEALLVLYGKCPGATLDNLVLTNTKQYGVLVTNCEGAPDAPITLSKLTFEMKAKQAAIFFELKQHSTAAAKINAFFRIKDCTFNGPGRKLATRNLAFVDRPSLQLSADLMLEIAP